MYRHVRLLLALAALASVNPLLALDPDRDFSGNWNFDPSGSNTRSIAAPPRHVLRVAAEERAIQISTALPDGSREQWRYATDGSETRYAAAGESRNSQVKWEGSALLVNTIVSSPRSYTVMDRWTLSRDRDTLTINRQIVQGGSESEGVLLYRREGRSSAPAPAPPMTSSAPAPALTRPPAPPSPEGLVVRAGTRIPLSLRNAIDTKHSQEGDRVYLDTLYPVVVGNRIVVPRGCYVAGTLTTVKPAGAVKGKGQLFIRFDSLTLPNGVTRDFRSRLASADAAHGQVDRQEGTITGERDKSGQAKTTAEGAGIGAGIGGLAGAAAGHPISGIGIGAAAGAAAGLASVLLRHRADAALPRGTVVEMLLDRDLSFLPAELPLVR